MQPLRIGWRSISASAMRTRTEHLREEGISILPSNTQMWRCAAYVRLSQEDGDRAESNSVVNQRQMIRTFVHDRSDLTISGEYTDDGYSGVNFDRPGFIRMMEDIQAGKANCIIVKDLSRLGRNYVEVGKYLEIVFPSMGIRFISITDNMDTSCSQTDTEQFVIPFKILFNDLYSKDISMKIRSQLEVKRKRGDFVGNFACYGYQKDSLDHNQLIIDPEAADVVRRIFNLKLQGVSAAQIADHLNRQGIMCPMEYKRNQGLNISTRFRMHDTAMWSPGTVLRILKNECYLGVMIQGKTTTPNHKSRKKVAKPESEWDRVEGTHEPIISRSQFDAVQALLRRDTRTAPNQESLYLFSGYLQCGDCGRNMIRRQRKYKNHTYGYYTCAGYHNKSGCSSHMISEDKLYDAVLRAIQTQFAAIIELDRIVQYANELPDSPDSAHRFDAQFAKLDGEIRKNQQMKMYLLEHVHDGLLTRDEYEELSTLYDERIHNSRKARKHVEEMRDNTLKMLQTDEWLRKFKEYPDIISLDRVLLSEFVDVIEIFEDKRIRIHFRFEDQIQRIRDYLDLKMPEYARMSIGNDQ